MAVDPRANLHVFSPDAAEPARHLIFRDWLRAHPDDRDRYRDAKLAAAAEANAAGEHVMEYNARKQAVIREIYGRAFVAAGLLPSG
ncbi:GrpB family protein [Microbacterium sp. HJ5]